MDKKMRKRNNKIWSGFFINLLGVILGILLTFGGNALWQQREENKRTREMLILVRNELKSNKVWFESQEKIMREDCYVYKKILEAKGDWKSIPIDTLKSYQSRTLYLGFNQLTTSAWQIFQNSEMIQKMTDKELVIRLTDCYFWINEIKNEYIKTQYWDSKIKSVASEVDLYKYFDALMSNKETVFFYTLMTENDAVWNVFPFIDAIIDYTIILLDKHGDYGYDMREKDDEIESFVEARMDSVLRKKITE
jgi:hypothetical protein